jgi:RHS repeat-associated protein
MRRRSVVAPALLLAIAFAAVPGSAGAQQPALPQILFNTPPGTNGIHPSLGLAYDATRGNGVVGVGWALTGLPAISRIQLGRAAGANNYGHSELGLLVRQGDGSYRSRKETFTRLVPSGTCGDGPCSWAATDRTGLVRYYGTTADSRLLKQGSASVSTWSLSRVQDVLGNYFDLTYNNDASNGALYVTNVSYTKGPGLSTVRSVQFGYESRTDVERGYEAGALRQLTMRLKSVAVLSGSTLIRRYRLDYEYGTSTGRSHLVAIQEYGNDGTSTLPARTFRWQHGGTGTFTSGARYYDIPQGGFSNTSNMLVGDFNGDGRSDVFKVYSGCYAPAQDGAGYVLFANGDGTFTGGPRFYDIPQWGCDSNVKNVTMGDFDGDGRTDLFKAYGDGTGYVLFSVGDGTFRYGPRYFDVPQDGRNGPTVSNIAVADFNGDGWSDFIKVYGDGNAYVMFGRGDGTFSSGPRYYDIPQDGTNSHTVQNVALGDFDADGSVDLFKVYGNGAGYALFSNGDGTFSGGPEYRSIPQSGHGPPTVQNMVVADFNGDHIADIFEVFGCGAGADLGAGYVLFGRGDGTFAAGPRYYDIPQSGTCLANVQNMVVGDFNGDGRADIFKVYGNGTGYVLRGNGDGTFTGGPGFYDIPQGGTYTSTTQNIALGDFNGDGRTDLFKVYDDGSAYVLFSDGPTPDLMVSQTNEIGGSELYTYVPAPQVPGAVVPTSVRPGIANAAPLPLLTRVTKTDGRGGQFSTTFRYADARYLPGTLATRRPLGFASIDAVDEATGLWTRTSYRQDPPFEQLVSGVARYAADGVRLENVEHLFVRCPDAATCAPTVPGAGAELVLPSQDVFSAYEAGVLASSETVSFTYDEYANQASRTSASPGLPTVSVSSTYLNDPAAWLLGRRAETKTVANGVTLAWTRETWNGALPASRSEWLDTSNAWITTTYGYDPNGNLTTVTEPPTAEGLTRTTTTTYDATFHAYPARVVNALGQVVTRSFDAAGLQTSETDANAQTTRTTYDVFGRKAIESGPDGYSKTFEYVSFGNPIQQHRASTTNGITRREWFDGLGFPWQESTTGDLNDVYVTRCKDAAGRPVRVSNPYFAATPQSCGGESTASWTITAYDGTARLRSITPPDGRATTYEYGPGSVTVTDPNGQRTIRTYDARQRLASIRDPAGLVTAYAYDALGRLIAVTLPTGARLATTYDSLNRKTSVTDPQLGATSHQYDACGNVVATTFGGATLRATYDALNRVVTRQYSGGGTVTLTYDEPAATNGVGRLTSRSSAAGTERFTYASSGLVSSFTQVTDGVAYTELFAYDASRRLSRLTYPDGTYADYAYTRGGNLGSVSLNGLTPPVARWSGYSASGKAGTTTYGNGVVASVSRDALDHVTARSTVNLAGVVLEDLTYDWYSRPNTGGLNLGSITDRRTSKTASDGANTDASRTYSYDALYRVTQAVGVWGTKTYAYDALGNATTFGGSADRTLSYTGQLLTSGTGLSGSVTYDAAGNVSHKALDGVTWDYTWAPEGTLTTVRRNGALRTQMVYDPDGNRVKKTFSSPTGAQVTTTYVEDVYEKRVVAGSPSATNTIYIHGNGALVATVTRTGSAAVALDASSRWRHELAAAGIVEVRSFTSLARRALLVTAALLHIPRLERWAALAACAAVTLAAGLALARSLHRRPRVRAREGAFRFASLGIAFVLLVNAACGAPELGEPADSSAELLSGDTTAGVPQGSFFYHGDEVNSVTVVSDTSGREVARLVYMPFGELARANSSGTDVGVRKFIGQELDEETGLAYFRARYYDPALGRYLSPDTEVPVYSDAQSFNRYAYARNNPIVHFDPTGKSWLSKAWKRFGHWLSETSKRLQHIKLIGGLLNLGFVATIGLATGGLGLAAWGSVDLKGMLRSVSTAGLIAGAAVLSIFTGGIASPLLQIAANGAVGFASGTAIAAINGASFADALRIGLVSGAIAAGVSGLRIIAGKLKEFEMNKRIENNYTVLADENMINPDGVKISPLGMANNSSFLGEEGMLGRLGMKVDWLRNWGWAHDGLVGVMRSTSGAGLLSLMSEPLGGAMGLALTYPELAGGLGALDAERGF